jgi:hypothetical protein
MRQWTIFMSTDSIQGAMATWAARDLPARLDVAQTAKLLGFAEHDIQVLMAARKLTPLGDPAPNAPKRFAAIEVIGLAADVEWLNKATKEVCKYWRHKRERRVNPSYAGQKDRRRNLVRKVSADSSPKPSPDEQLVGDEKAMAER